MHCHRCFHVTPAYIIILRPFRNRRCLVVNYCLLLLPPPRRPGAPCSTRTPVGNNNCAWRESRPLFCYKLVRHRHSAQCVTLLQFSVPLVFQQSSAAHALLTRSFFFVFFRQTVFPL